MEQTIRIGGASGFWGDAALATPQLLESCQLNYLVYDYLAEITMSIMARARASDESKGYAIDFVSQVLKPNLTEIARQGVKVVANAGGVNPQACAAAAREIIAAKGLDLTVAYVSGDDLLSQKQNFASSNTREMFSGEVFPTPESVASINAYLGAFPIAAALAQGADIVITGRCVDSAVTLGACIHAFDWQRGDYDKLAQGSLVGHLLECGTQATGGNFTDWEQVVDSLSTAGYPVAEVNQDGDAVITKPAGTGGAVTVGTVGEQLLYEIGDPQAYLLPDVACDFSNVQLTQIEADRVHVSGARGRGAPGGYKVSATYTDGFRAGQIWTMYGRDAETKAQKFADSVFARASSVLQKMGIDNFTETSCEVIGAESHYGAAKRISQVREVDVKIAAKHSSAKGIGVFLKEMVGMALTAPPGLTGFAGARPKPSPIVRLFSMIVPKEDVEISVHFEDSSFRASDSVEALFDAATITSHEVPKADSSEDMIQVPLESLVWGRSGDKGAKANIGLLARDKEFLPWIAAQVTEEKVAELFSHFFEPGLAHPVQRFYLPGPGAFNFLMDEVLGGGGVASLRADPQGKGYAQILLAEAIDVPRSIAEKHALPVS